MNWIKKICFIIIVVSLIFVNLYTKGWAEEKWSKNDPITDEWAMIDLLVARPIGIVAGVFGTGIFILSLPFTLSTGSVDDAAQMFIVKPFEFSFRKFPDNDM